MRSFQKVKHVLVEKVLNTGLGPIENNSLLMFDFNSVMTTMGMGTENHSAFLVTLIIFHVRLNREICYV